MSTFIESALFHVTKNRTSCTRIKTENGAARRREQVALEEEERRRVQQALFEAHVRGRGVPRAGEIFALL